MIPALLMGRKGSTGFPGKNLTKVLGKPMMTYPLVAAKEARHLSDVFVTTDDEQIKSIALEYGAQVIDRPQELCTAGASGEDVFVHGLNWIRSNIDKDVDIIVLLLCNCATITSELIDEGIQVLLDNPSVDSAVSVSRYNMWSPLRARKIDPQGLLKPFVPFTAFENMDQLTCDRDSQGDVWFADMGVSVVRVKCIDDIENGLLPQKWMGHNIYPLKQWGGFDVDYEWQVPMLEYWLRKNWPANKNAEA